MRFDHWIDRCKGMMIRTFKEPAKRDEDKCAAALDCVLVRDKTLFETSLPL